jgi:predicted lipid-binding transport protein (Tim44 family)
MDPSIIIFAALAAFLSYRLFSVLGTKGGHEPEENERPAPAMANADSRADAAPAEQAGEPKRAAEPWVRTIREDDPSFEPRAFLEGAKAAYEMIVTSFAAGELSEVAPYIDADVRKAFEVAIDGRRAAEHSMEVAFVGIEEASVVDAVRKSRHIEVTVDFRSNQTRVVRGPNGEVVEGDPNRIELVHDRWTFARELGARDPNWTLIATSAAG